jgi:transposase
MQILSDGEWLRVKAALDVARSGTGRPLDDERQTVEAIVWRQRNGAKWRAVPTDLGPWWKAAQLHIRWSRAGVWERAFAVLREAGQPELGEVFLDGTNVRAHHKAAGAKGGQPRRPSAARAGAGVQKPAPCATRAVARSALP